MNQSIEDTRIPNCQHKMIQSRREECQLWARKQRIAVRNQAGRLIFLAVRVTHTVRNSPSRHATTEQCQRMDENRED